VKPLRNLAAVLPLTAEVDSKGALWVGGCRLSDLAREHGTPLYIYDEATLRAACREWLSTLRAEYQDTRLAYAAKAFFNLALAEIVQQEGLGVDVASLGELEAATRAGFAADQVVLHGNNKSREELELALRRGIGAVVIDSSDELTLISSLLAANPGKRMRALIRVNPNIDPHTHAYVSTGTIDSKFGLSIQAGQAEDVLAQAVKTPGLDLDGLHFHLGSQLFRVEPYELALAQVLAFAAAMRERHRFELTRLSPGGGYGVRYVNERAPAPAQFARALTRALRQGLERHRLAAPQLLVEAGRSILARSGIAVYRVGSVKRIPDVRTYVAVDGGMGDNIRPALYGSRYAAISADRALEPPNEYVRVVGKYCESGDILIRRVHLPEPRAGDLLALPVSGAYGPAMASNYNLSMRPAIVLAGGGEARLIRRRETLDDLLRLESRWAFGRLC
jgi:diaminopimelate decarboxylase